MVRRARAGFRSKVVLALMALGAGLLVSVAGSSSADVTTVTGSAFGYYAKVGFSGGPQKLRGFGQISPCTSLPDTPPGCIPAPFTPQPAADSASPSVSLPPAGGNVSQTDADGASAIYGPAAIFSGIQCDTCGTAPPSGPITVSASGTTGPGGTATSSAGISLRDGGVDPANPGGVGPNTLVADDVSSTCTASETDPATGAKTIDASATVINGVVATSTDAGGDGLTFVDVPNPTPVNFVVDGVITNVGDSFHFVFNEQTTGPDGSVTVNAVHEVLLGPFAVGDVVIASSTCGVTTMGTSPTSTSSSTSSTVPSSTTSTTKPPTSTTSTTKPSTTTSSTTSTSIAPGGGGTGDGGGTGGGVSTGGGGSITTGGSALSRTGANSSRMAWLALLALILGVCLVRAARFRRYSPPWNRRNW